MKFVESITRKQKIIVLAILVSAAGFLLYQTFWHRSASDSELEGMKNSILADPKVSSQDLTEAQKSQFLQDFQQGKDMVLKSNFDSLQGLDELALAKQRLGDFEGAVVAWRYANLIRPTNSISFANLAALYHYDLRQYDKAEENYLISLANDSSDLGTIRNLFALYYDALKDKPKAEALLLKSIEDNPGSADLYSLLAKFYEDIGLQDKALEYYQKNLELYPGNNAVAKKIEKLKSELKR